MQQMNRFLIFRIILALLFLPALTYADDTQMYPHYMKLGKKAFRNENYRTALAYFNRAHEANPQSEEPLEYIEDTLSRFYDRWGYYPSGQFSKIDIYTSYLELAKFSLENEDYDAALQFFQYAQKINPGAKLPTQYNNLIKRKKEKRLHVISSASQRVPAITRTKDDRPVVRKAKVIKKVILKKSRPALEPQKLSSVKKGSSVSSKPKVSSLVPMVIKKIQVGRMLVSYDSPAKNQ